MSVWNCDVTHGGLCWASPFYNAPSFGDNFGASLEEFRLAQSFWKLPGPPRVSQKFPGDLELLPLDSKSNPELPQKFPGDFPRSYFQNDLPSVRLGKNLLFCSEVVPERAFQSWSWNSQNWGCFWILRRISWLESLSLPLMTVSLIPLRPCFKALHCNMFLVLWPATFPSGFGNFEVSAPRCCSVNNLATF